jgi:hypothetical protein
MGACFASGQTNGGGGRQENGHGQRQREREGQYLSPVAVIVPDYPVTHRQQSQQASYPIEYQPKGYQTDPSVYQQNNYQQPQQQYHQQNNNHNNNHQQLQPQYSQQAQYSQQQQQQQQLPYNGGFGPQYSGPAGSYQPAGGYRPRRNMTFLF